MEYKYHHGGEPERGDGIRIMQKYLNEIRIKCHGNWNKVQEDGVYGRRTRDAVKAYQIWQGFTPATGNLDESLQRHITSMYQSTTNTTPFKSPYKYTIQNPEAVGPQMSFFDNSFGTGKKLYAPKPVQKSGFPSTYDKKEEKSFLSEWGPTLEAIYNRLSSLIQNAISNWQNAEATIALFREVHSAIKSHFGKFSKLGNELQMLGETVYVRLDHLTDLVAREGKAIADKKSMELKKNGKLAKAAKALKIIDWAIPTCKFIYACYCYFTASDDKKGQCEKDVLKALDDLFNQICNSIIMKIIEIVAARIVTGAVAGSVVPGAGNVVGAIIGIIMSIVDIILYLITGKTVGDYIWNAISPVLKSIAQTFAQGMMDYTLMAQDAWKPKETDSYWQESMKNMGRARALGMFH